MNDRQLAMRYGAVSDVGRHRKKNDDSGYAGPHFLLIADGMGGAPAGNLASSLAVESMKSLDAPPSDDLLGALRHGIGVANDALAQAIREDPSVEGMGTTICGCVFAGNQIGVVHLGDSRGYLWRDGELLRLTNDHSWVQSLIDEGRITEEEAKTHAYRSMLLKVLDGRHDLEPDLTLFDVREGDRILFCSDGLSGFVSHERIERILGVGTSQAAAQELTTIALESGSTDNVTVIIGDVVDAQSLDALTEPVVVGAASEEGMQNPLRRLVPWPGRDQQPHEILVDDADFDPEELRYAPRPPQRFAWAKRIAVTVVVLALVAVGLTFAYQWSQRQYYVAAQGGQVTIYRGLQQEVPGLTLSHVERRTDLDLTELPEYARSQVSEGLPADDLPDARTKVRRLQGLADACADAAAAEWRQQQSAASEPTQGTGATKGTGSTQGTGGTKGTSGTQATGGTRSPSTRSTRTPTASTTTVPDLPTDVVPTPTDPAQYANLPQCGGAIPDLSGRTGSTQTQSSQTTQNPSTPTGPTGSSATTGGTSVTSPTTRRTTPTSSTPTR